MVISLMSSLGVPPSEQDWHSVVISLMSSLGVPPSEKWSGELSQISGAYYPKAVKPMRLRGQ